MLLEFEVSNLLSFNKTKKFTMHSSYSRSEVFNQNTIFQGPLNQGKKTYVHNSSIIYGANASGKTNLFYAISFLKDIVAESYDTITEPVTFRFTDKTKPTKIGIKFIQSIDNKKYEFVYQITIDNEGLILFESLVCKEILKTNVGSEQIVFIRRLDEFEEYHKDINYLVENYKTNNIESKAALSFFINDINKTYFKETMNCFGYKLLITAYHFIVEKIVISGQDRDKSTIANELINNPTFKEKVINALNEIDNSIEDFEIIDLTEMISNRMNEMLKNKSKDEIPKDFLLELDLINKKKKKVYDFKTIHKVDGANYSLEYLLESAGTRKFIDEFIDVVDCIENDKVYIIDEIENHYHELLQRYIINLFLNQEEGKTAQIITTTHSIEFLDPERFAKEQIWFVEKNRDTQESSLFRLSEFKDITYNNHNWKNLYLQGRLGAVPKVIM